ncbi:MAG: hypothetical protein J6A07_06620 [Firmicutes bacterium]|nr:hypothetical protein [Bacillota bacterium]
MIFKNRFHLSTFQIIILSFFILIITGTLLLMLPLSTVSGKGASFFDAIFTSTSAVCVTGLVVRDTATYWSNFGKFVILILIQIGGMGVVTVYIVMSALLERKIGLRQRTIMQEAVSAAQIGGIVKFTYFIAKTVIITEVLGAIFLFPTFFGEYGFLKGVAYSVFHSVSAFCNAGFDLMGDKGEFSSLTSYSGHISVNLTIIMLILIGGLGFGTLEDIKTDKLDFKKYRLQSKLILAASFVLLVLPFIYFFFGEFDNYPLKERILLSAFQTVTPRTAGFNTADLTELSESGIYIIILLMLIGGATGSTAGGIKINTFAVLTMAAFSTFSRKKETTAFGRRIAAEIIQSASTIFYIYVMAFVISSLIISKIEGLPLLNCMFETASAIATVGLSLGITTKLCLLSRCILMFLMFFGRVGGLTLIFAAVAKTEQSEKKFPLEAVSVG